MKTEPVIIVIPYLASAAQGKELEYAVAGWLRHFKHPHRIVIVGEGLDAVPAWIRAQPNVELLESPRVPEVRGQYRQHLDYVSCLRKVRDRYPADEGFIFVGDDCYAVNDFGLAEVQFLKMLEPSLGGFAETSPNAWVRDKVKTRNALDRAGLPRRNFTTHLPQWYEWKLLETLWKRYEMDKESFVMEDLYYNSFFQDRIPFQLDKWRDNLKLGVYTKDPDPAELGRAFFHKIWITNSPVGWVPELYNRLENYYCLPYRDE